MPWVDSDLPDDIGSSDSDAGDRQPTPLPGLLFVSEAATYLRKSERTSHRFRHAVGTTAPMKLPQHPALAAAVLGISRGVVEESYNRAGQALAVSTFQAQREQEQARALEDYQRRLRLGKAKRG